MKSKQNTTSQVVSDLPKTKFQIIKLGGLFVLIIAVIVTAFILQKKDKKSVGQISVPTVYASEMPGWWYQQYFGDSVCQKDDCKSDADPDKDGLTNAQEYYYRSNPMNAHTSGDTMTDGELVANNFDPSKQGKVSFEEASSDLDFLGEGLLFDQDIKKMINDQVNAPVALPEIPDSEINISNDNSRQAVGDYLNNANNAVTKYFSSDVEKNISDAFDSGDADQIANLKINAVKAITELKKVSVPSDAVQLHKDTIALLMVVPEVLTVPSDDVLSDDTNPAGNLWYQKAQQFMALSQKIDLENQALNKKYK